MESQTKDLEGTIVSLEGLLAAGNTPESLAANLFAEADAFGIGCVTSEDLFHSLKHSKVFQLDDQGLRELVKRLDTIDSGFVSSEEFAAGFNRFRRWLRKQDLIRLDTNRLSGQLYNKGKTASELKPESRLESQSTGPFRPAVHHRHLPAATQKSLLPSIKRLHPSTRSLQNISCRNLPTEMAANQSSNSRMRMRTASQTGQRPADFRTGAPRRLSDDVDSGRRARLGGLETGRGFRRERFASTGDSVSFTAGGSRTRFPQVEIPEQFARRTCSGSTPASPLPRNRAATRNKLRPTVESEVNEVHTEVNDDDSLPQNTPCLAWLDDGVCEDPEVSRLRRAIHEYCKTRRRDSKQKNHHLVKHIKDPVTKSIKSRMVRSSSMRYYLSAFEGIKVDSDGKVTLENFLLHVQQCAPGLRQHAMSMYETLQRKADSGLEQRGKEGVDFATLLQVLFPGASKQDIKVMVRMSQSQIHSREEQEMISELEESKAVFDSLNKSRSGFLSRAEAMSDLSSDAQLNINLDDLFGREGTSIERHQVPFEDFYEWYTGVSISSLTDCLTEPEPEPTPRG